MRVNEIFYSLQGEGFLAGVPSVFIRLAGCSLRCKWCDTKYAWDQTAGVHYSIDRLISKVNEWPCNFVVVTGGEPMINPDISAQAELPELIRELKGRQKHITIETAGIAFVPNLQCDLMSISPKLSNSTPKETETAAVHEDSRLDIAVLTKLLENYNYQLKFVVDCEDDLPEIQNVIEQIPGLDRSKVMLMPQANTRRQLLAKSHIVANLCKQTGYAFSQRLQLLL